MPEQVNPELDPLDGGNVTPTGEVVCLDAERQRALEHPDLPMRENRPDGLGIRDKLTAMMSDMIHPKGAPTEDKPGAFPKIVSWSAGPVTSPMPKFTYKFLGFDYGKGGYSMAYRRMRKALTPTGSCTSCAQSTCACSSACPSSPSAPTRA